MANNEEDVDDNDVPFNDHQLQHASREVHVIHSQHHSKTPTPGRRKSPNSDLQMMLPQNHGLGFQQ